MKKITIYTTATCNYCKTLKQELEKNNIEFEDRITSEWKNEWHEINSLTGMPVTPTVCYEDSYFIPSRDFGNPQQLINILKNFKKSEFSESRQIFEKIKTLNYGINTAFGRLDQLLKQVEQKIDKL